MKTKHFLLVLIVCGSFTGCTMWDVLTSPTSTPEERAVAQQELDDAVRVASMIVPPPWAWVISIGGVMVTALANGLFELKPRPPAPTGSPAVT